MSGKIYLQGNREELIELVESDYETERVLQHLIEENPALLLGDQISPNSPRNWSLVKPEYPISSLPDSTASFWVDLLFVDQDGILTFVEVKKGSNSEIRRKIVGQMLDYAANAERYISIEDIRIAFEAQSRIVGQDSDQRLADLVGTDNQNGITDFWDNVAANLKSGTMRLIFVSDRIPAELKRVVEFLNRKMENIDVNAIEIKKYKSNQQAIFIPQLVAGGSILAEETLRGINWTEERFFATLKENVSNGEVTIARKLQTWAMKRGLEVFWGAGKQHGTFSPRRVFKDIYHQCFGVYSQGKLYLSFNYLKTKPPFDDEGKRRNLWNQWSNIPGFKLPGPDEGGLESQPSISLMLLEKSENFEAFIKVADYFFDEVEKFISTEQGKM